MNISLVKSTLLDFCFGIRDSFHLAQSIIRYLSPGITAPLPAVVAKLFLDKQHNNEYSQMIASNTVSILKKAGKFMLIVLCMTWFYSWTEPFLGIFVDILYWVIVACVYLESALSMWVWQQEIGSEAVNMEIQYYQNVSFVEYQIEMDQQNNQTALGMIHRFFSRFLFRILFQLQNFVILQLVGKLLPFPLNYIFRIPLFALQLSVNSLSTKIPFQQHLPYYLDKHLAYLIGLNLIQSCILHVSKFPIFTGMEWAIQPFFLLNTITREPPRIVIKESKPITGNLIFGVLFNPNELEQIEVFRDTYKEHLKGCLNSPEYQERSLKHKGYMSLPVILTPHTYKLLDKLLRTLEIWNGNKEGKDD